MQGKELIVQDHGQVGTVHQADNDRQVLATWLHRCPQTTQRAYTYEVQRMLAALGKPLQRISLGDLQGYFSCLGFLAPASQARAFNAVKSLFAFAQRIGYLAFNLGTAIRSPKNKNILAERIFMRGSGSSAYSTQTTPPNRILSRVLYAAGLRVSEVCGLKWRDVQEREGAGQITVYAKGAKLGSCSYPLRPGQS